MGMTTAPASVNGSAASASGGTTATAPAPASAPSGGSAQAGGVPAGGAGQGGSQPQGGGFLSKMTGKVSSIFKEAGIGQDGSQPVVNEMAHQHDANAAARAADAQQADPQAQNSTQPGTEPAQDRPAVSQETRDIQARVAKMVAEGKMPGQQPAQPAAPQGQQTTPDAAKAAPEAAKAQAPADPWAAFEAEDDGADLFQAMGYDPKELDDKDENVKAIKGYVANQNKRTKALVGHLKGQFREVAEAIAPLMQLADKHQMHTAVAHHIQTQFAVDSIANLHPFYAQQLGVYGKGELSNPEDPKWTARDNAISQAMQVMQSGLVPTFDAALKYVVETTYADVMQKAENQQTPTAPPGSSNAAAPKGGTFEQRVLRRVG